MKNDKTNVMRVLEQHKIDYASYTYGDGTTASSGIEVAELLGKEDGIFRRMAQLQSASAAWSI